MNPHPSSPPPDPEQLLARGLRETTPAFEARCDDLRRRLAREGPGRAPISVGFDWLRLVRTPLARVGLAAVVLVAGAIWLLRPRTTTAFSPTDPEGWYADALEWDASLRPALVLADAEARETITMVSTESTGGDL